MTGYTRSASGTITVFREPKARWVSFVLASALLGGAGLLACSAAFSGWSGEARNMVWSGAGFAGFLGLVAAFVRIVSGAVEVNPGQQRIRLGRERALPFRDVKAVLVIDDAFSGRPRSSSLLPPCQIRLATKAEDREGLASLQALEEQLKQADPAAATADADERLEKLAPLFETPSVLVTSAGERARNKQTATVISDAVGVPLVEISGGGGDSVDLIDLHVLRRLLQLDAAPETRGAGIPSESAGTGILAVSLVFGLLAIPVAAYHRARVEQRDAQLQAEVFQEMSDHEDREIRGALLPRAKLATRILVMYLRLADNGGPHGAVPKGAIDHFRNTKHPVFTARFLDELGRSPKAVAILHAVARGHRARKSERQIANNRWIVVRTDGIEFTVILQGRRWLVDAIDISKRTPPR